MTYNDWFNIGAAAAGVVYVVVLFIAMIPATRVTARRGLLWGLLAAIASGVATTVIFGCVLAAVVYQEQHGREEGGYFALGFGLLLHLYAMGLFWAPLQLAAILWTQWRRGRRIAAATPTPATKSSNG